MCPEPTNHRYAACYCEENVWHLVANEAILCPGAEVVFLSNPHRTCALWAQRAGHPVVWDYHVILLNPSPSGWMVWDLDSLAGVACPLDSYLEATFQPLPPSLAALRPRFRCLDVADYRRTFSSDRSHMRTADGHWSAPPPFWSPIHRADQPSFLRWTVMHEADDSLDLESFRAEHELLPSPSGEFDFC